MRNTIFPGKLYRLDRSARSSICRRGEKIDRRQIETPGADHFGALREGPRGCRGFVQAATQEGVKEMFVTEDF